MAAVWVKAGNTYMLATDHAELTLRDFIRKQYNMDNRITGNANQRRADGGMKVYYNYGV